MKLKLTKIYRSFKDKEGNELKTRDGRNYERVVIWTQEYGERAISLFGGYWNKNWKEADSVELDIEEVAGRDGKKYLNGKQPDPLKALTARVEKLEKLVAFHFKPEPSVKYPASVESEEEILNNMAF